MIKNILIPLVSTFFLSLPAFAGVYIEPAIGYETGSFDTKVAGFTSPLDTLNGNSSTTGKGVSYGLRLGYEFLMLAVGAEYYGAKLVDDDANDLTVTDMGAFVGLTLPMMFKFSVGYIPSAKIEAKKVSTTDSTEYTGSAMKFGIGYTGLPFLSINLESITREYDEITDSTSVAGQTFTAKVKSSTTMLSISLPF